MGPVCGPDRESSPHPRYHAYCELVLTPPLVARSAGPDMDAETVNVYSHWGDEMRRHQAQQTLKAKKARKKGPRHKVGALAAP